MSKEVVSARQTCINMATRAKLALWMNMAKVKNWLSNAKKEINFMLAESLTKISDCRFLHRGT